MDNTLLDPDNQQFYNQANQSHGQDKEEFESEVDQFQKQLEEAERQAQENMNGWKRAQADLENFRRRHEAESSEWISFGKQAAFVQILPTLDSLEQAVKHMPDIEDEKYKQWRKGLEGIIKQIDDAIKKMGIEKIEAEGKRFDPHTMEAVREVDGEEDDVVAEQYQTGYMLNGKVLRPAQVAITRKR